MSIKSMSDGDIPKGASLTPPPPKHVMIWALVKGFCLVEYDIIVYSTVHNGILGMTNLQLQ